MERVQAVAEHVYSIENGKLGWRTPKSDGTLGGGNGKTDIYLSEIGGSLFGYATPDRGQASTERTACRAACTATWSSTTTTTPSSSPARPSWATSR